MTMITVVEMMVTVIAEMTEVTMIISCFAMQCVTHPLVVNYHSSRVV
jgi:hypothetical protein